MADAVAESEFAARQLRLKQERDRFLTLAFCWADVVLEIDPQLNVVFSAGATGPFFGRNAQQMVGVAVRDLIAPADGPLAIESLKRFRRQGRIVVEMVRIAKGEYLIPMSFTGYCLDPIGGPVFLGLRKADPAARALGNSQHRDRQTGLLDADGFADMAAARMRTLQEADEAASVTLVSVPGMVELGERLDAEDKTGLEQTVGALLRANSIGGDCAAQVGEGRFSVLHGAGSSLDDLLAQIEAVSKRFDPSGAGVHAEAATIEVDRADISEADLTKGLLYTLNHFKDGGEVAIGDLAANMGTLIDRAIFEVNEFKMVLKNEDFYVALQPIVHIKTGEVHHYEALCRFNAKPGESPFKSITFAEETGLIHDFDLAMACKVIDWLNQFPRNNNRYRVAVNVSGFSIGVSTYLDRLQEMLRNNMWTRGKLMFEITESSRMSNLEQANNFIQRLRGWGYHVCLDDFGAGAASFQYLSMLDVDVVKLDGSAVKNAIAAPKGRAFMSALTELCRRMGVETIAEMVDGASVLHFCRDCGCDYAQGYLFGKPSPKVKDFNPLPNIGLFQKKAENLRVVAGGPEGRA